MGAVFLRNFGRPGCLVSTWSVPVVSRAVSVADCLYSFGGVWHALCWRCRCGGAVLFRVCLFRFVDSGAVLLLLLQSLQYHHIIVLKNILIISYYYCTYSYSDILVMLFTILTTS